MAERAPEEGKGMAFVFDTKKNPDGPDCKTRLLINGQLYEFAGWFKKGVSQSTGKPWRGLSFNVKPAQDRPQQQAQQQQEQQEPPPSGDNIPF